MAEHRSDGASLLIILGGLPGTGKTTIARTLARRIGAMHLRIDTIESALRSSGIADLRDIGYRVAYALAGDNLRLGRTVIADSVNPLEITRQAWRAVAEQARVKAIELEVVCSDRVEHQRRVETRVADLPGPSVTWEAVVSRTYEPWRSVDLVIDTSESTADENVDRVLELLRK